jgi:hypothetical protein
VLRQLLRTHSFVVQLLFTLLGILVLLLGVLLVENKTALVVVEGIGGALLIASLVAIFQDLFGLDIPTQIEERLQLGAHVQEMGLAALHPHIGDESIFNRFEHAHSIDMMYNTAKNTTYRYLSIIKRAILEQGCAVRILVADPSNPAFQIKPVFDGLCPGTNIVNEINDVVQRITLMVDDLRGRTPPPTAGSIEIRFFSCLPTGSIVIVDNELARYTPYMPYAHSSDVPSFDASGMRRGKLFQSYRDAFDRVWEKSAPVMAINFSPIPQETYISLHLNTPRPDKV